MSKTNPKLIQRTGEQATGTKVPVSEPTTPVELATNNSKKDIFDVDKWRRDFDEYAKRALQKLDELHKSPEKTMRQLLAKAHAMQEMGEIHDLAGQRFEQDWEKHRGLSLEQLREIRSRLYVEELAARMQQDVLQKTIANWEEHRRRRIELIQWSKLSDSEKKKWLEFYNKPSPNINLSEGEYHADQTQECPDGRSPQINEQ